MIRNTILFALFASVAPAFGDVPIRPLVLSGQPVPGEPGKVFQFLRIPEIDDAGDIIFRAEMPRPDPDRPFSFDLFGIENGQLLNIARDGGPAPGITPPTPIIQVQEANKTEGGVVFRTLLRLENPSDFAHHGGPLSAPGFIIRSNTSAAVSDGATYRHIQSLKQNRQGQVVLSANLASDLEHDMVLSSGTPGDIRVFARTGQPAHGLPAEFTYGPSEHFSSSTFFDPLIDDAGRVAYVGFLAGPDVVRENESALWYGTPDNPQLVVRSGTPIVPGSTDKFLDFGVLRLTPSGKLLFTSSVAASETSPGSLSALFVLGASGPPQFVARTNQPAPGVESALITQIHSADMNDSGQVTFSAELGPVPGERGGSAVYVGTPGNIHPIAIEGQPAPDTFGDLFRAFGTADINDLGQVAFTAGLSGSTGANGISGGLYATDSAGDVIHVIHIGQLFEVAPGDVRTVVNFEAGNFNNVSELVFQASFSDGTYGIFVAIIPEPSLALTLLLPLMLRRARSRALFL